MTVLGAVLTGGRSRRMGRDKAFVTVDGVPMVVRAAAALGVCDRVVAIGGDLEALSRLGMDTHPDPHQGSGPLGGLLTGLRTASDQGDRIVVVVACDLPDLSGDLVSSLVAALSADDRAAAAVARTDRIEPMCAAWRVEHALPAATRVFETGERAVRALLAEVTVVEVPVASTLLTNVNRPEDLSGR